MITKLLMPTASVILFFSAAVAAADHDVAWRQRELTSGWNIKSIPPRPALDAALLAEAERPDQSTGWLAVTTMPAMVHDVLLAHGKIETPWLPGAAEKCRWVAEQDWLYTTRFSADTPELAASLRFLGLDTIVDVYLNGRKIASHANMYLPLTIDVTGQLQRQNTLVLHFHTVFAAPGTKTNTLRVVGSDGEQRVRRPRQNYSSYLGPNPFFSRVGVYDQIVLETHDGCAFAEIVTDASLDETLAKGLVTVDATGNCRQDPIAVRLRLYAPDGRLAAETTATAAVERGKFTARCQLGVDRPQLWWPRGYGEQALYRLEMSLLLNGRPHQVERRTIGFRHVAMPQRLHFVINGKAVRLWGGDWVAPDWQSEVWNAQRVRTMFAMAENANFNAFRVWGEVAAPRDDFYQLADARGFLLWQDFTNLTMASDDAGRAICRQEAACLIKRLKHHPSLLVWNGGNEAAMWHHEDYNREFTDKGPWPGLPAAEDVGAVCRKLDPARYYQPSSPYYGMNPNDPREGSTHGYTNLWFVPGYDYLNFAAEDARIAAPQLSSLKRFMRPEELWPEGYSTLYLPGNKYPYPKTWLRYTASESWKKTGPVEQFYDATDPAALVYRLGMAESLYYQETVERQRRGREATDPSDRRRCGGYIAWKFNDSWPQVYSGKIDYFLEPYHAYYALRRAYAPVLLSFDIGAYIYLWAINDSPQPVVGKVRIQLYHLEKNEFRKEIVRDITVAPGQSVVVVRLDEAGIRAFRREHILFATLTDAAGNVVARANAPADIERRIAFPTAKLDVTIQHDALRIATDKFARAVTLEGNARGEGGGWFFDDNYFDLLPGEVKTVRILGRHTAGQITAKPWYSPHETTVTWKRAEDHPPP